MDHTLLLSFLPLYSVIYANQSQTQTRTLSFSSPYWASGLLPSVSIAFSGIDVRVITSEKFSIKLLIEIVEKYKITNLFAPPSQMALILQSREFKMCDHSSLTSIMVSGSIVTESLRKKFKETFPDKTLTVAYGMTEATVALPLNDPAGMAVGKILYPNNVIKIVDDDGNKVGIGKPGELRVKQTFKFRVRL